MRLCVIALDYDGTIAVDGRIDPSIPPPIAEVRAAGLVVVLVTGRRLDERGSAALRSSTRAGWWSA